MPKWGLAGRMLGENTEPALAKLPYQQPVCTQRPCGGAMAQKEQWQVSGSAPEVYEAELVPAIFGAWAPVVVDLCDPRPGERVLDLACGTGVVARLAARRVGPTGRVVGVDPNPRMLAVARAGVAPEPGAAPVEWRQAGAEALPLADAGFDVVCCQLGLQFFIDRPVALREMHRVLAPGGQLALMVWRSIDRWCGGPSTAGVAVHRPQPRLRRAAGRPGAPRRRGGGGGRARPVLPLGRCGVGGPDPCGRFPRRRGGATRRRGALPLGRGGSSAAT
jgi:SAM-dependent methyltransferase